MEIHDNPSMNTTASPSHDDARAVPSVVRDEIIWLADTYERYVTSKMRFERARENLSIPVSTLESLRDRMDGLHVEFGFRLMEFLGKDEWLDHRDLGSLVALTRDYVRRKMDDDVWYDREGAEDEYVLAMYDLAVCLRIQREDEEVD